MRVDVITIENFQHKKSKNDDHDDDENDDGNGETITAIYMFDPATTCVHFLRL
jgi:hypothetical protein